MRAVLILLLACCAAAAKAELPVAELSAGMYVIRAEVADNFPARTQGLMHRESLAQNAGMLFVFDEAGIHCMWMKNTLIPLSVAFLDEGGAIVNIADMQPRSENSHCAARPVRYALEMNKGWFAQRGIKAGTRLRGLEKLPPR
ncbi:MAG: DUF192 domain-containing protein [Burkholderiales bacterium]